MSEQENDGEGGGARSRGKAKRSRMVSEERRQQDDDNDGDGGDYSGCRPLHTRPNALLAAAAATADADAAAAAAAATPGSDWSKHHVLYGSDNHYMFFRWGSGTVGLQAIGRCWKLACATEGV